MQLSTSPHTQFKLSIFPYRKDWKLLGSDPTVHRKITSLSLTPVGGSLIGGDMEVTFGFFLNLKCSR